MKKQSVYALVMVLALMIIGCGSVNSAEEQIEIETQIIENADQTDTEENTPIESIADETEAASDVADEHTLTFTGTIIDHVLESLVPVVCVKQLEDVIPYEAVFFELPDDKADWGLQIGAVVTITCADAFTEQVPYSGTLISIEDATIDNSATPFTEEQIEEAKGIAFGYFAGAASTVESIEFLEEKHYENGIDCCNFIVSLSRKGDVWPDRIISLQLDNGAWEIVNTFQSSETERKPWESVEPTSVNPDKLADTKDKQTSEIEIADDSSENVTKKESIYVYNEESQISEIALSFSLKNVSSTGATLVFDQYDADAPKGELMFGDDFVIEVLKNGVWEAAPIPVEGNYAFHAVAYNLPCEKITEREIVWKVPYGELESGEYRIGKSVDDFVESGNFDKYMVYAHFTLN